MTAEWTGNFEERKLAVFRQAWMNIRDLFYDPKYHGADWTGEVKRMYGEAMAGVRTLLPL